MIFTFVIYNFILFGATFIAYIYEKSLFSYKRVFIFTSFFIPFLFLALRYNIGTDYNNYVDYFYKIANQEIVSKEAGYIFINYFISYYKLDVQWLFVFFAFFYIYYGYKALPKKGFAIGIFLFITMMYLYEGFSAIRQGLAIVIMMYAIIKYVNNIKLFLLYTFIAMLFHAATAFVFIILYPFIKINFNKYFLIIIIFIFYLIVKYTNFHLFILEGVFSIFPKYQWYLHSKYMQPAEISSGIGIILKILIAMLVIFFKDKIIEKNQIANIVINLYVLYIISIILHLKIMIFGRVEHIFIFASIISLVYFFNILEGKIKYLFIILILSIYYLFFIKYIITGTKYIDNDIYINPYQTILERIK